MPEKNIECLVVGPIATNCWIYYADKAEAAIIDPGDEAERIAAAVKKLDLSVKYILLTHGHFDHIAAVPFLLKAFDVKPQIAIHRLDAEYLGESAYSKQCISAKAAMGSTSIIDESWRDMPPAGILLEDGDTIGAFTVLHLPGHTQGSAAFWDKKAGVLFSGDTLFKDGIGRTDLPDGSESQMFASLRRLFTLDKGIEVYPGHGGTTIIGREKG